MFDTKKVLLMQDLFYGISLAKKAVYTANELPQPQEEDAFGFWNTNPRAFNPSLKSISIPAR